MGALLSIDYISHTFRGQKQPTLKEIAVTVEPGEQVALIGRSGCGKSTLLHMLAGLMMPSEGCVRIHGRQVIKPSARWNMMFQRPSLYPWMSVKENAALGLLFAGQKEGIDKRIDELLELVGLSELKDKNVQQLSGGQQQRVALARSLATDPELLLLDEPFSALDAFTRVSLQDEVSSIARKQGITTVIVTHDIDEAVAMSDRVLIMSQMPGQIVGELHVDIKYPRNREHREFSSMREELMQQFSDSSKTKEDNVQPLHKQKQAAVA